ncbi:hypothetical protein IC615_00030 [Serratia ureilytica]
MIKMNIDTDKWATWDGILQYYKANEAYLQGQLGNPKAPISLTRNTTITRMAAQQPEPAW